MKRRTFLATVCWMACAAFSLQAPSLFAAPPKSDVLPSDNIAGSAGVIRITPIFHGTVQIEYRGKTVVVDPVMAGSYKKKADLVLITHAHPDHLDRDAILKVSTPKTVVVMPTLVEGQFQQWNNVVPMSNGDIYKVGQMLEGRNVKSSIPRLGLEAVEMYNVVRGPKAGQKYHPKGDGNGYILTLGGKRIYIAGDTEATPEMKKLRNIDIAFLPMNLPFTMTATEAATGVKAFKPRIVYPYHYRYPFNKANDNPQQFANALKGTRIQVRLRNWYPIGAVQRMMQAMSKR